MITEPTCTEGGYTTYTCSCGDTIVVLENITVTDFETWDITDKTLVFDDNCKFEVTGNLTIENGNITANINKWVNILIRDNSINSYIENNKYDPLKNTGTLTVNVASGIGKGRLIVADFNADGKFDIKDTLLAATNMTNKRALDTEKYFFSVEEVALKHIVYLLKKAGL